MKYSFFLSLVIGLLLARETLACTICYSPLGQQVRMGILDPNLIFYMIAVILPFIILGLVVYLLFF